MQKLVLVCSVCYYLEKLLGYLEHILVLINSTVMHEEP